MSYQNPPDNDAAVTSHFSQQPEAFVRKECDLNVWICRFNPE